MKLFKLPLDKEKIFLVLEIFLLFFCFFLPSLYIVPETQATESSGIPLDMVQYIIASIPQMLLLVYVIRIKKDIALKNFGITRPVLRDFLYGAGLAVTLFVLIYLLSFFLRFLPETTQKFINPQTKLEITGNNNIFLLILFSLVTGYKEELFFRSYLLTRCRQLGVNIKTAIIVISLLFAVLHLYEGIFGFLFTALVAVYFSIIYLKTKSLNTIAISHGLFNAGMLLLSQSNIAYTGFF